MYTYKYSVGRYKNYRPGYHVVDIAGYSVADLEKLFDILYIVVYDDMFKVDVSITLEDYKTEFAKNPTLDINKWLLTQNGKNLIKSDIIPSNEQKFVKLERIFTHGYFHYPGDVNLANDRQEDLLNVSAPDIRIQHYAFQKIDYAKINDYSLFTVNGVFMRSVARDSGIYLLGAGKDWIKLKEDIRVGALNFQMLGKVKTIPITKKGLIQADTEISKRYLYKSDTNLDNKTIWLVVNGQLIVDPDLIYRVNKDHVMINLNTFDVTNHYLSFGKYTRVPKLTNLTKFDQYKEDALTADNSFIILIDNPSIGVDVVPLTTFHYPNALHTEDRFQHPLVLDNGMFPVPYIRTYGVRQRLLNHDLRVYNKYPFATTGTLDGNVILNDAINQGDPGHLNHGYTFRIHGINLRKV